MKSPRSRGIIKALPENLSILPVLVVFPSCCICLVISVFLIAFLSFYLPLVNPCNKLIDDNLWSSNHVSIPSRADVKWNLTSIRVVDIALVRLQ